MANIEKRQLEGEEASYRVKVRLKGFPTQTATFRRLTDAKKWAQHTEAAIREGRFFKTSEAKRHTLAEAIDRYIQQVLPKKPKSFKDQNIHLQWWKKELGSHTLSNITPAVLVEYRDKLANGETHQGKERASATVNRYLAALSHLFTVLVKEWGWADENPLRKISKLKEPRGRVRFLSDEERTRLLKACQEADNPWLYLVVVLCLSTGARKMEIMTLTWDDVDFNRRVITLHETKNGERRILPLVGKANELLQEYSKTRNPKIDLLFPGKDPKKPIDLRSVWETALEKAEIQDFRFHDLRHSAASYLAMNGASLAEIAEVLGHKTLQMVKRYAHLSEAHTASVVSKMNEKIFG